MASLLDALGVLETLGFYTVILPFILVFGIVYGILTQTKIFGDNTAINSTVAVVVALIVVSMVKISIFVTAFLQFTIAFLLIIFLIMLVFLFMGVKAETIGQAMLHPAGYATIILLFVIFFFLSVNLAFPEISQVDEEGGVSETGLGRASRIIGNPTFLGLIVMFAIFTAAAAFITYVKTS